MDLQTITYVIVGLSFALYLGIAFWARAGSTGEFYVAGGGVHPVANGMATAADWMSAASFISMAGSDCQHGLRWFRIPDGLDRWLCVAGHVAGSVPAQVRQVHGAPVYR